jgi:hypothetical protein
MEEAVSPDASAGSRGVRLGADGGCLRAWRFAGLESRPPGRVECALQRVVERTETDLIARTQGAAGPDEVGAGAALLVGNDRSQHGVNRRIERDHDRVVVVEAAAVHLGDDLRAWVIERGTLQIVEGVAPDLAVEVAGPRSALMRGERRLVRGAPGAHHEAADPSGAGHAGRQRACATPDGDASVDVAADLDLVVEEERPLGVGLR